MKVQTDFNKLFDKSVWKDIANDGDRAKVFCWFMEGIKYNKDKSKKIKKK